MRPLQRRCRRVGGLGALAAFAALGTFAHPASADLRAPGTILAPGSGETVVAGQEIEVRWVPLGATVDEFELLLSVDDGRTFPIRLTEMLEPGVVALRWAVPNLPATSARLRVRFGRDGEEREAPVGGAFSIVGEDGDAAARLSFSDGEWWTARVVPASPVSLDPPERRLASREPVEWVSRLAVLGPRVDVAAALAADEMTTPLVASGSASTVSLFPVTSGPSTVPQRE